VDKKNDYFNGVTHTDTVNCKYYMQRIFVYTLGIRDQLHDLCK